MNTTKSVKNIQPFKIEIPQTTLNNLHERLERTRFPNEIEGADWDYGANLSYIKELCDYWQNNFNWRKQEAKLNRFNHFQTEIDGLKIHSRKRRRRKLNSAALDARFSRFVLSFLQSNCAVNDGTRRLFV
jgi:Epoxide hydrolase N terminus